MAEVYEPSNQQQLRIAPLELSDIDEVEALERKCFTSPWPRISFEISVFKPDVDAQIGRLSGILVCYLITTIWENELLIANLAVHPEYRRQGLAATLLAGILERAKRSGVASAVLDVRESNWGAIRLYQSLGFRVSGKRPGYYTSPKEDSLVMKRSLD